MKNSTSESEEESQGERKERKSESEIEGLRDRVDERQSEGTLS